MHPDGCITLTVPTRWSYWGSDKLLRSGDPVLTDQKLPGYRFPLSIIGHAVWLYHRFILSYRDVEELLFERGIEVSRESVRTWCINFSEEFAQGLRHREPRRGSRWHLDEMHVVVGGATHGLWRAVDEHGAVLEVLLQRY
jgi:putative transposase